MTDQSLNVVPATFVIGLGQLGTATCQQLAADTRRIYGENVPLLRLLSIDIHPATVDETDLHTHFVLPVERETLLQWQANHPTPEILPPVQADAWQRAALRGSDDLPLFRPLERLAWFYALSGGANAPLQRLVQNALVTLRTHPETGITRTLLTLLVGHLAEPVGSSLAVDVSYLVQHVAAEAGTSLTIIPWGYTALPTADAPTRDKLAGAAALRELGRFTAPANHTRFGYPMRYQTTADDGRFYNPPFDLWYCYDIADPLPEITAALQPLLSKTAQDNLRTTKINRTGNNSYNDSDSPFVGTVRVQSLYFPVQTIQQRWACQDVIDQITRYQTLRMSASQIAGYQSAFWSLRNFPGSLQGALQQQDDSLPEMVQVSNREQIMQQLAVQLFEGLPPESWQANMLTNLYSRLDDLADASDYAMVRQALRRATSILTTYVERDDRNHPRPVDTFAQVLDEAHDAHLAWFDDTLDKQLHEWQQTRRPRPLTLDDVRQIVRQLRRTVQARHTHYTQQATAHRQQVLFPALSAFDTGRAMLQELLRRGEPGFLQRLFNRDLQNRVSDFCVAARQYIQAVLTHIFLRHLNMILSAFDSRLDQLLTRLDTCHEQIEDVLAILKTQQADLRLPVSDDVLQPDSSWLVNRKKAYYNAPADSDLAQIHHWRVTDDATGDIQIVLESRGQAWLPDAPATTARHLREQALRSYEQARQNLTVLDYLVNHCSAQEQAGYTAHLRDFPRTLTITDRPTHQQSGFLVGISAYRRQHVQFVDQQLLTPFSTLLGGQAIAQVSHDDPQRLLQLLYVDSVSLKTDVPLYQPLIDRYRTKRDGYRIHAFRAEHEARRLELTRSDGRLLHAGVVDLLETPQELLWFWIGEELGLIDTFAADGRSNQKYIALRVDENECMLTEPGDTRRGRAIRAFLAGEVMTSGGSDGVRQLAALDSLREALRQAYQQHINQRLVRWLSRPTADDKTFFIQMGISRIQSVAAEKRYHLAEYQFFLPEEPVSAADEGDALSLLKQLMLSDHAETLRDTARY